MARTKKQLELCELARRLFIKKARSRPLLRVPIIKLQEGDTDVWVPKCFEKLIRGGITWGQVASPEEGYQIIYLDRPIPRDIKAMPGIDVVNQAALNWDELMPPWASKARGHFSLAHQALYACEDFATDYNPFSGNPNWDTYSTTSPENYKSANGKFVSIASFLIPPPKAYYRLLAADMSNVGADYSVEADATACTTYARLHSVCRFVDADTWYGVMLETSLGASSVVVSSSNGPRYLIIGSAPVDDSSGKVRLEVVGNVLKAYFDGEEKVDVSDSSHTQAGYAGIHGWGGSGSATPSLDNFKVYTPATRRLSLSIPKEGERYWSAEVNENFDKLDIAPGRILLVERNGCDANGAPGSPFIDIRDAYSYAKKLAPSADQPILIQLGVGEWDMDTNGLDMDTDHIHIRGSGRGRSILTGQSYLLLGTWYGVEASISSLSLRNTATSGAAYAYYDYSTSSVLTVHDCEITASGTAHAVGCACGVLRNCVIRGGDPAVTSLSGMLERCTIEGIAEGTASGADAVRVTNSDAIISNCLCLAAGTGNSITAYSSVSPTLRGVICEGDLSSNVTPTSDSSWCVDGKRYAQGVQVEAGNAVEFGDADLYVKSAADGYLDVAADSGIRESYPTSAPSLPETGMVSFYLDTTGPTLKADVRVGGTTTKTGSISLTSPT